jgi:hypothetical protein
MYEIIVDKQLEFPLYSSEDFIFPNKVTLLKFISDNVDDGDSSFRIKKLDFEDLEDDLDVIVFANSEVH